jgi:hypothetical protein
MRELVNRRERAFARAWKRAQARDLPNYHRLVEFGLEAHHVRDRPGPAIEWIRDGEVV